MRLLHSTTLRAATTTTATFCLLLLSSQIVFAQEVGEMPITTSSKEALTLFLQGRDKSDNAETAAALTLFEQALEKDPNFALAYVYRWQFSGSYTISRQNLKKAMSLADKVSPGEKLWILAAHAQSEVNSAKQKEHLDQLLKLHPSDKRVHNAQRGLP